MRFIVGKKIGMTQLFRDDGRVIPVTRIQAGPCTVTQVKTEKKDNESAVQLGYGTQKPFRLTKAEQGHLKGLPTLRHLKDFGVADHTLERGDTITVSIFAPGDKVKVTGTSKGKGFQGVVKRHGFHGAPASHGHKDQERMPGSIGSGGVQRVFKGTRMGGQMGDTQVTVQNLEIVSVDVEGDELCIKGAVPGARGSLVLIQTPDGTIDINRAVAEEVVPEEVSETEELVEVVEEAQAEPAKEESVVGVSQAEEAKPVTE